MLSGTITLELKVETENDVKLVAEVSETIKKIKGVKDVEEVDQDLEDDSPADDD